MKYLKCKQSKLLIKRGLTTLIERRIYPINPIKNKNLQKKSLLLYNSNHLIFFNITH